MPADLSSWVDVLACPTCRGELYCKVTPALVCRACGQHFALEGGILSLIAGDRRAELDALSLSYRQARYDEGWRPMTERQLLDLPDGSPAGYPPLYWQVRRQTFYTLRDFLQRQGPAPDDGAAADVGAGTGWLAHRLAQLGYRTLALDASLDGDFGLGASTPYRSLFPRRFLPVRGDMEALPLRRSSFGVVVFNASLHYARDLTATLHRAARALRPGGSLIVLDTPIAARPRPGCGTGDRHLGSRELAVALHVCGLEPRQLRIRRGLRWHAYQLRAALRGAAPFSFPMVIGLGQAEGDADSAR